MTIYATHKVLEVLSSNRVFNVLNEAVVRRRQVPLGKPAALSLPDGRPAGLAVEMFAVPGKVPLYLENPGETPELGAVTEDVVGVKVMRTDGACSFFYIPGCAAMPPDLAERLIGAGLLFFDGTTWTDTELRDAAVGEKTAARMGHMCISGEHGSIAALAPLGINRKIFVHINNTNPILISSSPERAEVEAQGWEVAEDGMEILLWPPS